MLSIIIVSFNAREDLVRCLESLHDPAPMTPHEIIVVDNASSDDSAQAARRWTNLRVIEAGRNLGFARGTNLGIRASRGDLLLLLNSDTIVPPGAVDHLVDEMERDDRVAVVGPRLVDREGRVELSFGRMIGPFNELRQKLLVRGHAARAPVLSALAADRIDDFDVAVVDADSSPEIPSRYGVLGLPTIILFSDGQPVMQVVGARSRARLEAEIDAALAPVG